MGTSLCPPSWPQLLPWTQDIPHCRAAWSAVWLCFGHSPFWEPLQPLQDEGRPAARAAVSWGRGVVLELSAPHPGNDREALRPNPTQSGEWASSGPSHEADQLGPNPNLPKMPVSGVPRCCAVHLGNRPSHPPLAGEEKPRAAMGWGHLAGDKEGSGAQRSRWVRCGCFTSVTELRLVNASDSFPWSEFHRWGTPYLLSALPLGLAQCLAPRQKVRQGPVDREAKPADM